MTVRVVVVDDHPIFRDGLAGAISSLEGFEVVGRAADGEEAVAAVSELAPDVVVMDLHMPGMNGIEATRRITGESPETAVVVLTMLEDDSSVYAAMRAGARGYLVKGSQRSDIARALDSIARGEVIFSPEVAGRVLAAFSADRPARGPFPELTDREREILDLVAQGLTNQAIADRLVLSQKTIRNHVSNVFFKLQVADRGEAIVRAREGGLGGRGPGL